MSKDIYVDVKRAGTTIYSNVYMQLDTMSQQEAAYYGGTEPYERFNAYALSLYDIRQTDLLVDRNNTDPKTSTNYQYRIINIPEFFLDQHGEIVCDLIRGT
jgi:hypothetical protein